MSSVDSPFVPVPLKCPFCGKPSTQRYIKSRMYRPEVTEPDNHVVVYHWENPEFSHLRPNFYHIWHCPSCHLCDEREVFRGEDNSGGKLELIKEKLLNFSRLPNSIILRLGRVIDFSTEAYAVDSAIVAHLLAIYQQELLSPNMRQYPKLARFYLRTAWLFREKVAMSLPDTIVTTGFQSFADFLESFKNEWPGIVVNEEQAQEAALLRYQEVLNRTVQPDLKYEMNVMFLVVALLRRCGRNADALRAVRGIINAVTRARQTARAAIRKGVDTARHESLLTYISGIIDRTTTLAEELGEIVFKEELPGAKAAVLAMGPVDARTVLERLREQNFSEITCRRVAKVFESKSKGLQ